MFSAIFPFYSNKKDTIEQACCDFNVLKMAVNLRLLKTQGNRVKEQILNRNGQFFVPWGILDSRYAKF
jgi:hypothetical protein